MRDGARYTPTTASKRTTTNFFEIFIQFDKIEFTRHLFLLPIPAGYSKDLTFPKTASPVKSGISNRTPSQDPMDFTGRKAQKKTRLHLYLTLSMT